MIKAIMPMEMAMDYLKSEIKKEQLNTNKKQEKLIDISFAEQLDIAVDLTKRKEN